MKKILLILCTSGIAFIGKSQIVNGGFETWNPIAWEEPDTCQTSNSDLIRHKQPVNVTKATPAQNGNYAVKLETKITATDTNFAYVLFGDFGDSGPEGGFPYSQKPATINGYYKSNIVTGDSAGIIVAFRKGGSMISFDMFKIGTTNSAYTPFSFPLSISTYSVSPDSVVFVAVSSVPTDIDPAATPKDGTWIIFDNVSFGGSGITQQVPNTDFELWTNISIAEPQGWTTYNTDVYTHFGKKLQAEKTTDKYLGTYALKLTTLYVDNNSSVSSITNGSNSQSGYFGGIPFNRQIDTLIGYYKYTPSGPDSAYVNIGFSKAGSTFDYKNKWLLPASSYTYFELPFTLSQAPDTARIDIASSKWPVLSTYNGSQLILDELRWKSIVTGVPENSKRSLQHTVFPVPAKNYVDISLVLEQPAALELSIYDSNGKCVYKNTPGQYPTGKNVIRINTGSLSSGNYYYTLTDTDRQMGSGKIVVE